MQITVGPAPVRLTLLSEVTPAIQNLGPGTVYIDSVPTLTAANGYRLPVGATMTFPRDLSLSGGELWLVADVDSDVRYMAVG